MRCRVEARDGLDYAGRVVDVPFGNFEEERLNKRRTNFRRVTAERNADVG